MVAKIFMVCFGLFTFLGQVAAFQVTRGRVDKYDCIDSDKPICGCTNSQDTFYGSSIGQPCSQLSDRTETGDC